MNKLMKPERLSLDPNSPTVAKEWRHWRRTFENYLASFPAEEGEGGNAEVADTKLKFLINPSTSMYLITLKIAKVTRPRLTF